MTPELAQKVKATREAQRLSMLQLARRSGVVRNTIDRLERGESVQMKNFIDIAAALGLEIRLVRVRKPTVANKLNATREEAA